MSKLIRAFIVLVGLVSMVAGAAEKEFVRIGVLFETGTSEHVQSRSFMYFWRGYAEFVNRNGGGPWPLEVISYPVDPDPASLRETLAELGGDSLDAVAVAPGLQLADDIRASLQGLDVPVFVSPDTDWQDMPQPPSFFSVRQPSDPAIARAAEVMVPMYPKVTLVVDGMIYVNRIVGVLKRSAGLGGDQVDIEVVEDQRAALDAAVAAVHRAGGGMVVLAVGATRAEVLLRPICDAAVGVWVVALSRSVTAHVINAALHSCGGLVVPTTLPSFNDRTLPVVRRYLAFVNGSQVVAGFDSFEVFITGELLRQALARSAQRQPKALLRELNSGRAYDLGGLVLRYGPGQWSGSRFEDVLFFNRQGRVVR